MQIFEGIDEIRSFVRTEKLNRKRIGLVPTMGALHAGHLSLIRKSLQETDVTIASIFVNPLQFNNPTDLEKYPKTIDADVRLLEQAGCQALFLPSTQSMYGKSSPITFSFGSLDRVLEGEFRPGHFSGVATVVSKLFNIIQPDVAFFGQKDFQQFLIIKEMVDALNFPIDLRCESIVREADGLALSSRNARLSPKEREVAPLLYRALTQTREKLSQLRMDEIRSGIKNDFMTKNVRLEYLELASRDNLAILSQYDSHVPSVLLIAAYVGDVRLIDNILV